MRLAVLAGYAFAVAVLSLLPGSTLKSVSFLAEIGDKWAHAGMYMLLSITCCWVWTERLQRRGALSILVLACAGYGLVLECLQGAIPALERTFSVGDSLANTLGAIAGACLWTRRGRGNTRTSVGFEVEPQGRTHE